MRTVFLICLVILAIFAPIVKVNQWKKIWGPKEERDAWLADPGRIRLYRISLLIIGIGMLWFPFSILILGYDYGSPSDNSSGALVGGIFGPVFLLLSLFYKELWALSKKFVYDRNVEPPVIKPKDTNPIIK